MHAACPTRSAVCAKLHMSKEGCPRHNPTGYACKVRGCSHLQLRVVPRQVLQPVRMRAPIAAWRGAAAAEGIVVLHLEGQRRGGLHRRQQVKGCSTGVGAMTGCAGTHAGNIAVQDLVAAP